MKIIILAEGDTEKAFRGRLKRFLDQHCEDAGQPKIGLQIKPGTISQGEVVRRTEEYLRDTDVCCVVVLSEMYPTFNGRTALQAKREMQRWVSDSKFHAHVARHDFEAWLLVAWKEIVRRAGYSSKHPWGAHPEEIDGNHPPAHRLSQLFEAKKRKYKKTVDGKAIMDVLDLEEAARKCPELKNFLNTLLKCAGLSAIS